MNVDTPLWLLLTASAFGGAALTGLITLGTKLVDLRHRHDETRREHYVALFTAYDDLQQAVVNLCGLWNVQPSKPLGEWSEEEQAQRDAVGDAGEAAHKAYAVARRAEQIVYLFAPRRVAKKVLDVSEVLDSNFHRIYRANDNFLDHLGQVPESLPEPEFPSDAWYAMRRAMRRDLGVRGRVR
ncbi:hypothetical protein IN07_11435 [Modestobacter caceresii]|uniref:DUF4760 domain-containing protein n=1 Tax=Modestobacter caceresii TaxID=1522368 RepID=A0A098Y833_9ACTN|nr:hypothetical protein [Modestobacter caceresii]KGH46612.1 hypothetical protein IN07_11435 [Modestobacter caceresii]